MLFNLLTVSAAITCDQNKKTERTNLPNHLTYIANFLKNYINLIIFFYHVPNKVSNNTNKWYKPGLVK